MSYNTDLQQDNHELDNILASINSLPIAVDLTSDTVTPDTLFKDKTAHDKSNKVITGTFSIDNELNEQNNIMDNIEQALVGKGLPDTNAKKEIAGQATITKNGTQQFTPPADSVYNLFTTTVNVPQPSTQEKTINISQNGQVIVIPDKDKLLSKVTVITDTPVPKIEQSVKKIIKTNGITTIQPDVGKVLKEVSVNVQVPPTPIQEKTVNINTNGQTVVIPNQGFNLSKVLINTNVAGSNMNIKPFSNIKIKTWTPSAKSKYYTIPSEDLADLSMIMMFCDNVNIDNYSIHSLWVIINSQYTSDTNGSAGGSWEVGQWGTISSGAASYNSSTSTVGDDAGFHEFQANKTYTIILLYGL